MSEHTALSEKSPNIPSDSESISRKRSHDEYSGDVVKLGHENQHDAKRAATAGHSCQSAPRKSCIDAGIIPRLTSIVPAPVQAVMNDASPGTSPALTDSGNTATSNSSPPTPSKSTSPSNVTSTSSTKAAQDTDVTMSASIAPPKKRSKLTPAEKEAREKELEQKKREKEEKARVAADEKRKKEEEREERRKQKEEEKKQKDEEREERRKKKEEEDKIKAQKVKEKEDKKREAQEAKEKEERKQKRLNSFFIAPSTPKKATTVANQEASPEKEGEAEYRKRFQPFFVRESTAMASGPTQLDDETRAVKSHILDEFMDGKRTHDLQESRFDPVSLFALPSKPAPRGKIHHPVKHIMENTYKAEPSTAADTLRGARDLLSKVPMKVIAFSQDVRPPYCGTVTFKPFALGKDHMRKLARMSTGRRLPLDYDYDSEGEWQEEEGEDLDAEDDEEEIDDEDDMDGFLDDSDDAGPARIFANAMEPDSTGICYANGALETNALLLQHRMEVIVGKFPDLRFILEQTLIGNR